MFTNSPDVTTVQDYIDHLEEPRKSEIQALHGLIRKAVPKLEPSIQLGMIGYGTYHYKYESGREGDCAVISLASRKQYISVYVAASENGQYIAEKHKPDFPKASIGKSCIRFKKFADIDQKTLVKVIQEGARILSKKR